MDGPKDFTRMRSDMAKLIVERPRSCSSLHVPRRFARLDAKRVPLTDDEHDPFPSRLGLRRAASLTKDRKWLSENLSPLRRFLFKQVGRPWDKVWAAISAHVRADNTVQQHVRDHIQDFVAYRTFLKNGQVYSMRRRGGPEPVTGDACVALYVDPRTGLLCRNKAHSTWRQQRRALDAAKAQKLAERLRVLGPDRQLHLLGDGNWWEVTLAAEPPSLRQGEALPVDVVERAGLSTLPRADRYDRRGVYAVAKRPLSRREIKAHGLRG
jgi:hypothetical protein